MIRADLGLCLGCLSCSNVCPSQKIVRTETFDKRIIRWNRCREECDLCVEFCPARALSLVPFDEAVAEPEVSFDLIACKICGSRYATEAMLRRIEAALSADLQKDSMGLEWIRICPTCRRKIEAERVTREMVLRRSRKGP